MTTVLKIGPADLDDPMIAGLLETHARTARAQTGEGSAHALDMSGLWVTEISVWAAWRDGFLVGVGALRRLSVSEGEVKAMHTAQDARRTGVGQAMLTYIIGVARAQGMTRLSLETGSWPYFAAARALYAANAFVECPPFGDYRDDPNSVFMTLDMGP